MSSDLPDGYELSTDPARLDVDQLHEWLSVDAYWALGSGGNYIYIDPADDLVVVWRWSAQSSEGFRRIVAAITN